MAKILVIDDERAIRNTLKEILEFEGYTVEVAENGRMGLEMALAAKYDLIYTDIKMPEMDGMELLQAYHKVMQEQGGEEAPVVMISGHGTVETAVDALKNGAYDFIVKPLDMKEVFARIKAVLRRYSAQYKNSACFQAVNSRYIWQIEFSPWPKRYNRSAPPLKSCLASSEPIEPPAPVIKTRFPLR